MVYFPDINDFQRLIQFFLKKLRPPFVITQRRQRVNYLIIAEMLSEIGFHSPEGNQIINLHAVLFFHILKQRIKLTVLRLRRRRFFGLGPGGALLFFFFILPPPVYSSRRIQAPS